MMHLKITDEIRERCLREAAHEAHINDRIVTSTPQTLAERGMTMLGSTRATPRIRSYIYCDAVDACFYYAGAVPSVVVAARWTADSSDIAEGSKKLQIAAEVVRRMMTAMDKAMKAEKDRQWAAYMEERFGTAAVRYFCLLSRYKYLYRCGLKDGATQELSKANWYKDKFLSLGGDDKLLKIVPDNAKAAAYQRMGGNACIEKEAMRHES